MTWTRSAVERERPPRCPREASDRAAIFRIEEELAAAEANTKERFHSDAGRFQLIICLKRLEESDSCRDDRKGIGCTLAQDFGTADLEPLFRQSDVPEVTELAWLLTTLTLEGALPASVSTNV